MFFFSGVSQLHCGGAGQELCPVILPHMSSSAKPQGFLCFSIFLHQSSEVGLSTSNSPGLWGAQLPPAPPASATAVLQPRVAVPSQAVPVSSQGPQAGFLSWVCPLLGAAIPRARRGGEAGTPPGDTMAGGDNGAGELSKAGIPGTGQSRDLCPGL